MDYTPPGSSVHGILQARILEWVAIPFSRGSSWPRNRIWVSCVAGRFFTVWATREAKGHLNYFSVWAFMNKVVVNIAWRFLCGYNGHDWVTSLELFTFMHWRRKWQPTPVFLPGESQGWEPGGLPSIGSHRVGHSWRDLAAATLPLGRYQGV